MIGNLIICCVINYALPTWNGSTGISDLLEEAASAASTSSRDGVSEGEDKEIRLR